MSVIIKGMKMPKSCDSCDLIQFDDEGLEAHCPLSPYYRWCGTPPDYRPEGCPLVKVPTPHGRLIDAERLFNIFEPITSFPEDEQIMYVEAFLTAIKQAQTIIEAEVSEE